MVKEVVKKFLFILKPGYKSKKFYVWCEAQLKITEKCVQIIFLVH
jgi:hypothetical protein